MDYSDWMQHQGALFVNHGIWFNLLGLKGVRESEGRTLHLCMEKDEDVLVNCVRGSFISHANSFRFNNRMPFPSPAPGMCSVTLKEAHNGSCFVQPSLFSALRPSVDSMLFGPQRDQETVIGDPHSLCNSHCKPLKLRRRLSMF